MAARASIITCHIRKKTILISLNILKDFATQLSASNASFFLNELHTEIIMWMLNISIQAPKFASICLPPKVKEKFVSMFLKKNFKRKKII